METDGTISSQQAADIAAHILVDHFTMMFTSDFQVPVQVSADEKPAVLDKTEEPDQYPAVNEIENSVLSTRAKNALTKNSIITMAALEALTNEQIGSLSGLGEKTINEILEFLKR